MSGGTQCGATARLPIRARSRQRQERSRTRRYRGNAPAELAQLATSPLRRCRRVRRSVAAESSESAAVFLDGPSRVLVPALLERCRPAVPGADRPRDRDRPPRSAPSCSPAYCGPCPRGMKNLSQIRCHRRASRIDHSDRFPDRPYRYNWQLPGLLRSLLVYLPGPLGFNCEHRLRIRSSVEFLWLSYLSAVVCVSLDAPRRSWLCCVMTRLRRCDGEL
jgi:hypothetical protein